MYRFKNATDYGRRAQDHDGLARRHPARPPVIRLRPAEEFCALHDVFAFYRDFTNLPRFLGDVMAIEPLGPATSRWTMQGPLGVRADWTVRTTEERQDELIRYETVAPPPLRTTWEIRFAATARAGETEVREVMTVPAGMLGRVALALIGKFPAEEVSANLRRLKEIMETGEVSDTSYAVARKFERR